MRLLILSLFLTAAVFVSALRAALPSYSADISVDVTAENAAAARERAMQQANRQAVSAIAANFTTREGLLVLNKLTDDQLLNFIKETTVLEEKTSNFRYLAKLRITANDQLLRQYLQEKNVPLVVASSADVLIIPVFHETEESQTLLWEENNFWRLAWEQFPQTVGSIRLFALAESNLPSLTAEQALDPDMPVLRQLNAINGGNDVYTAEAWYNGEQGLTVRIINLQTGKNDTFNIDGLRSSELFHKAVEETALHISDELKGRSIVSSTETRTITALYKFSTLSSWLKVEEKIAALTAVEGIRINAIGNGRIQFQIDYIGDFETLNKALENQRLQLTDTGNYYTLVNM